MKSLIKKETEGKKKIELFKGRIDTAIVNLKEHMERVIADLYIIRKEKLYFFDRCRSLKEFIYTNGYDKKLGIKYQTIQARMIAIEYAEAHGIEEGDVKDRSNFKMLLIKRTGANDRKKIIDLTKKTSKQVLDIAEQRQGYSGKFSDKKYVKRPGTTIRRFDVELPAGADRVFNNAISYKC